MNKHWNKKQTCSKVGIKRCYKNFFLTLMDEKCSRNLTSLSVRKQQIPALACLSTCLPVCLLLPACLSFEQYIQFLRRNIYMNSSPIDLKFCVSLNDCRCEDFNMDLSSCRWGQGHFTMNGHTIILYCNLVFFHRNVQQNMKDTCTRQGLLIYVSHQWNFKVKVKQKWLCLW